MTCPSPPDTRSTPRWARVAAVAVVVTSPLAAWAAIGDLSFDDPDPDHLVHPLTLTPLLESVLGTTATSVFVVSGAVLVVGWARHRLGSLPPALPVLLSAFGLFAGWSYRVVTAGVIGANIGGALVLVLAVPVTLATAIGATALLVDGRRRRRERERT